MSGKNKSSIASTTRQKMTIQLIKTDFQKNFKKKFFHDFMIFQKEVVDHFWGVIINFELENMSQTL